jgi:hypothetical protein
MIGDSYTRTWHLTIGFHYCLSPSFSEAVQRRRKNFRLPRDSVDGNPVLCFPKCTKLVSVGGY